MTGCKEIIIKITLGVSRIHSNIHCFISKKNLVVDSMEISSGLRLMKQYFLIKFGSIRVFEIIGASSKYTYCWIAATERHVGFYVIYYDNWYDKKLND